MALSKAQVEQNMSDSFPEKEHDHSYLMWQGAKPLYDMQRSFICSIKNKNKNWK